MHIANDITRADDKILGFVYQFYYFVNCLLDMKETTDSVGFEVLDDVHIEQNGTISFIQLKHSRNLSAKGKPINLATSSQDLWKTLSNWSTLISKQPDRNFFLESSWFIFVTNKSVSANHRYFSALNAYKKNQSLDNFRVAINNHANSLDKDNPIKGYCKNFLMLSDDDLTVMLDRSKYFFGVDNIVRLTKDKFKYLKSIPDSRINGAFNELVGVLWGNFFDMVYAKRDFKLSLNDFYLCTLPILKKAQSDRLYFMDMPDYIQSKNVLNEIFAQQLCDIAVNENDILEYEYNRMFSITNLNRLHQENEITSSDMKEMEEYAIERWKEDFQEKYALNQNRTKDKAIELFTAIMKKDLKLCGQEIDNRKIVKGHFINLSNEPKIGWLYDWNQKYKKKS